MQRNLIKVYIYLYDFLECLEKQGRTVPYTAQFDLSVYLFIRLPEAFRRTKTNRPIYSAI